MASKAICRVQMSDLASLSTRIQWANAISALHSNPQDKLETPERGIRDWDLILNLVGVVENRAENKNLASSPTREYPARYQVPDLIINRLNTTQEQTQRAELFALGGILYKVFSGNEILGNLEDGEELKIQAAYTGGKFPDDVWSLDGAERVLECWCPGFSKEIMARNSENQTLLAKMGAYIQAHPYRFGLQVTGGLLTLASVVALPVLGAIGFGAAGPLAGSAAAGWQASQGAISAGSLFAWCQSAAMGGAAVSGIVATGAVGASAVTGAVIAGALDDVETSPVELKEVFLGCWRKEMGHDQEKGKKEGRSEL